MRVSTSELAVPVAECGGIGTIDGLHLYEFRGVSLMPDDQVDANAMGLLAEFRLLEGGEVWLSAEVLDFTVAGVRVRFEREQRGLVLNEADIEWKEALFRFGDPAEALSVIIDYQDFSLFYFEFL